MKLYANAATIALLATLAQQCGAVDSTVRGQIHPLERKLQATQKPLPTQTFFVPLDETPLFNNAFYIINPAKARAPVVSMISVSVSTDNTVIWWDQWEDGYDADVAVELGVTTQVWGDGDATNGCPPGRACTNANDILRAGDSIVIQNSIPLPRDARTRLFDGGDRIQSSFPIAVTRAAYPTQPGSLLAGGVEVLETTFWGLNFEAPVGTDIGTSSTSFTAFEYSTMFFMAKEDNTIVTLPNKSTVTLKTGQTGFVSVKQGEKLSSNLPIQVHLITGDINSQYEMRWYAMIPSEEWKSEYFAPVGDSWARTKALIYNPGPLRAEIRFTMVDSTGKQSSYLREVAAKQSIWSNLIPDGSGCSITNTNRYGAQIFLPISVTDTEQYSGYTNKYNTGGQYFDWGYPVMAREHLTSQVLIGWGWGCTNNNCTTPCVANTTSSCSNSDAGDKAEDRSKVWVSPVANADIYVDYQNRGTADRKISLKALQSVKIADPNDQDMSGSVIWATLPDSGPTGDPVDIAAAWGQDPAISFPHQPISMDLGTVVVPMTTIKVAKIVDKVSASAGDQLTYTIRVSNVGQREIPANKLRIFDTLDKFTSYVAKSTTYEGAAAGIALTAVTDDSATGSTPFPLDGEGYLIPVKLPRRGGTADIKFRVTLESATTINGSVDAVVNQGYLKQQFGGHLPFQAVTTLDYSPAISIDNTVYIGQTSQNDCAKAVEYVEDSVGMPVSYCLKITNTGKSHLTNIKLVDEALSYSADVPGILAPGASNTILVAGNITNTPFSNTATVTGTPSLSTGVAIRGASEVTASDPSSIGKIAPQPRVSIMNTVYLGSDAGASCSSKGVEYVESLVGKDVVYCFLVKNEGNTVLVDAVLDNAELGLQDTVSIGTLAPGASKLVPVPKKIEISLVNNAKVTAFPADKDGNVISNLSPVTATDPSSVGKLSFVASIKIENTVYLGNDNGAKCGTPAAVEYVGDFYAKPVTYCIKVINTGNSHLSSIVIDDKELNFTDKSIGILAPTQSVMLSVPRTINGSLKNFATVTANPVTSTGDDIPDLADVTATDPSEVGQLANNAKIDIDNKVYLGDFKTQKCSVAVDYVEDYPNKDVTYCFTVKNSGETYLDQLQITNPSLSITDNLTGLLAPGASRTVAYKKLITGPLKNIVTVTANPVLDTGADIPGQNDVTASDDSSVGHLQYNPQVKIDNTVYLGQDGGVKCGTSDAKELVSGYFSTDVTYCFNVSNPGNAYLNQVKVTDPELNITDTTSIALLAPGAWKLITVAGKIDKKLTNNAVVTANPCTENGADLPLDDVTATDPSGVDMIPFGAGVTIQNTVYLGNDGGAACGNSSLENVQDIYFSNVTYCFVVKNIGDTRLENIVVNDKELNVTNMPVKPLAPGEVAYLSVPSKILVNLTNTATVKAKPVVESCTQKATSSPPNSIPPNAVYSCAPTIKPICGGTVSKTWANLGNKNCCDFGYKYGIKVADDGRCGTGSLQQWTTSLPNGGYIDFKCKSATSVEFNSTGQGVDLIWRKAASGGERYCMQDMKSYSAVGDAKYATSHIDVCWDTCDTPASASTCSNVPGLEDVQDDDTSSVKVLNFEAKVEVENVVSQGVYQPDTTCGTPTKPPSCQKPDSVYSCPMSKSLNPVCKANTEPTWAQIGNMNCCDFGYNTGIKVADDGSCGSGASKQWTTCLPNGGYIDLTCKNSTSVKFVSTGQKIDLLFRKAGNGGERYCIGDATTFETGGNGKFGTSHIDICWDTTDKYVTDGYNTCTGNTPVEKKELVEGRYSEPVTYHFTVTNTGKTCLNKIQMKNDDLFKYYDLDAKLCPGESTTVVLPSNIERSLVNTVKVVAYPITEDNRPIVNLDPVTATDPSEVALIASIPKVSIENTVYIGKDNGASCGTNIPAEKVVGKYGTDVVYCFKIINTGETYLSSLEITNEQLVYTNTSQIVLAPAASMMLSVPGTIKSDLVNTAKVVAEGVLEDGSKIPNVDKVSATDPSEVGRLADQPLIAVDNKVFIPGDGASCATASDRVDGYPNTPVVYCFTVKNVGDSILSNVEVTNEKLSYTNKTLPVLKPNDSVTITVPGTITANTTNTVQAIGTPVLESGEVIPGATKPTSQDDSSVGKIDYSPKISIENRVYIGDVGSDKCATDARDYVAGIYKSPVVYCFTVTNQGDTWLDTIKINNQELSFTGPVKKLGPGMSDVVTVPGSILEDLTNNAVVTANPVLEDGSDIPNLADVTSTDYSAVGKIPVKGGVVIDNRVYDDTEGGNSKCGTDETYDSVSGVYNTAVMYCFIAKNVGETHLNQIVVTNKDLNFSQPVDGLLAPGESKTISLPGKIVKDLENTAVVTANPVLVTGEDIPDLSDVSAQDKSAVDRTPLVAAITIDNTVYNGEDGGSSCGTPRAKDYAEGLFNSAVTYCLKVTNTGESDLDDVTIMDDVIGITSKTLGFLGSGSSVMVPVSGKITGTLQNNATVIGTPCLEDRTPIPDMEKVQDSDDSGIGMLPHESAIDVQNKVYLGDDDGKSCSTAVKYVEHFPGAPVTYCFTVTNTGKTHLNTVLLNNPDLSYNNESIGQLEPGETVTLAFATTIEKELKNVVTVTGNPTLEDGTDIPGNDVTASDDSAVGLADFKPSITIQNTVYLGDDNGASCASSGVESVTGPMDVKVVYCFTVQNTGNTHLGSVKITDAELSFADDTIGMLAPGESKLVAFPSTITSTLKNNAVATGNPVLDSGTDISGASDVTATDDSGVVKTASGDTKSGERAPYDKSQKCLQNEWKDAGKDGYLVCATRSVVLENVSAAVPGKCKVDEMITLTIKANISIVKGSKKDLGWYVASDGGDALDGFCAVEAVIPNTYYAAAQGTTLTNADKDSCGDVTIAGDAGQLENVAIVTELEMPCKDENDDGTLDFAICFTWRSDDNNDGSCVINNNIPGDLTGGCYCTRYDVPNVDTELPPTGDIIEPCR